MRALGIIALLIGIAGFALTLSVDTSVPVTGEYGKRVHNVGLISEKQNLLLTFAVIVVVGTIFVGIGRRVRHSSSAGSASGPQEDKAFEEKWLILTKYDESTQHALKRLNAYGAPAVEALKKAFFAIGDPSKLPKVADQIAREIEEGRQTALANEVQHVRQMATHQQLDMLTEAIA